MRDCEKETNQRRLPLLPPFLRVLSVGIGVTSSATHWNKLFIYFLIIVITTRERDKCLPMRPIFMPERARARRAD